MALVEKTSLPELISTVIDGLTGGLAVMEGVLKFVDRVRITDVEKKDVGRTDVGITDIRTEEDAGSGKVIELDVAMRAGELVELDVVRRVGEVVELDVVRRVGEVDGGTSEDGGVGEGLSDDGTCVSDEDIWMVVDDSSSELVIATGGPCCFPPGPGPGRGPGPGPGPCPGGPFLLFACPGAFAFLGSRAASESPKGVEFGSL